MISRLKNIFQIIFMGAIFFTCSIYGTISEDGFVSIYGTEVTEGLYDNISVQFQYGIPSTVITTTLNQGIITTANSLATLTTNGTTGSVAQIQTNNTILYRSGHEAYAVFTVTFTGDMIATTSQFIGPIDASDGFAVGFDGPTFGVTRRNNGVDTFVPQASFNQDTINGSGPSGFNYDPTKLNIFRIGYGYLGASIITFQIMASNGDWITFHTIEYPNTAITPSISQPFLPITARVEDLTGTHIVTLSTASWNAGIVGSFYSPSSRYRQFVRTTTILARTETYYFALQNISTFNSKPNKIQIKIASFWGTVDTTVSGRVSLFMRQNPTLTGTNFVPVDTNNSVVAISTVGTWTPGTGTISLVGPGGGTSQAIDWVQEESFNVILYPGDVIAITATASNAIALGAAFNISLAWEEQF